MSQLVFVHGVATRPDGNYDQDVLNRDTLFTNVAFAGRASEIHNPLWGDVGQRWAWNQSSLPTKADRGTVESFSLSDGMAIPDAGPNEAILAAMAKLDGAAAIDTLFAAMVEARTEAGQDLDDDEVADFKAAASFFEAAEDDVAAIDAADDHAFVDAVRARIEAPAAFAFGDALKDAADWIAGKTRNLISTGLVDNFRDDLNPMVARFMGDIFVYLKDGPQREAIRNRVRPKLLEAHQKAQAAGEALIAVGHSMGGIILYDMLTDPAGAGLPDDFQLDVLATIGSQVGVFEEFKLYAASDPAIPSAAVPKAPKPARVGHWLNVFDPVDLLSFRCEPIFDGVTDYMFSSVTGLASAHSAYFQRPRFFARLKARLDAIGAT